MFSFPGWVAIADFMKRMYNCVTPNDRARMYRAAADVFMQDRYRHTLKWNDDGVSGAQMRAALCMLDVFEVEDTLQDHVDLMDASQQPSQFG